MTVARRSSFLLACLVSLGVVAWFGSGSVDGTADPRTPAAPAAGKTQAPAALRVEVSETRAQIVTEDVRLQGQTAPNRQVTVRAETAGRVTELLAERGARVRAGEPVARLAMEDRAMQRRKAEALVTQQERDYAAIRKLAEAGHLAGTRVDEALANLEAARAELARIEQDIAKTTLRTPFDGILNERSIEVGDFVSVRDAVFTVVDVDPIIFDAAVAQRDKSAIAIGDTGAVRLITGEELSGTVRYLSAVANDETRTFKIELSLPNPEGKLPTGVSAEATVPARSTRAHSVSPGWLVRTSDDRFGVFLVDENAQAIFAPVEIIRAAPDRIWVTGLPDAALVVSAGQGFLRDGQAVRVAGGVVRRPGLPIAGGTAAGRPPAGISR